MLLVAFLVVMSYRLCISVKAILSLNNGVFIQQVHYCYGIGSTTTLYE